MKIYFPAVFLFLTITLWATQASAEEIYIRYDQSCMHRLEFAYGFTPPNMEYIKYHVMLGENEAIILEIGPENASSPQSYFSNPTVGCGDAVFTKDLVGKIRNNSDQVFMVRQAGSRYYVSKVNNASYFRRDNRGLYYDSWQYQVNTSGGLNIGDNITKKGNAQGIDITYQGPTKYDCADAYKFEMRFSHSNDGSYREMFFVPGIGIVEERPTGDPQNIYKLKNYDGKPLSQVLTEYCSKGATTLSANFLPGSAPSTSLSGSAPSQAVYHEVERGETLYSISRKYNVGVSDLQDWNSLTSNTLTTGTRLRVSPPQGSGPELTAKGVPPTYTPPAAASSSATLPAAGGAASIPTASAPSNLPAWKTTNGFHLVQPGETVASIALKYGYTEARFRDMNNLGSNDFVKIGQTLKTTDCAPTNSAIMTPRGIEQPVDNIMGGGAQPYSSATSTTLPTSSVPAMTASASNMPSPASVPASSSFDPYGSAPDFSNLPPIDQEPAGATTTLPGGVVLPNNTYPNADYFPSGQSDDLQPRGGSVIPGSTAQPQAPPTVPNTATFGTPIPTTNGQPGQLPATSDPFSATSPKGGSQAYPSSINYQNAVPAGQPAAYKTTYVVQEGDTIESIAKRFGTTPEKLRTINNLDRNEILIPYKRIYID